jgi:hypothetical protein
VLPEQRPKKRRMVRRKRTHRTISWYDVAQWTGVIAVGIFMFIAFFGRWILILIYLLIN